jgi:thiol-disulfide isomerase/thioredoxin
MKAGAVVGSVVAISAGLAVILFLRTSDKPGSKGVGVGVGVKKAAAAKCTGGDYDCLPEVTFVSTEGEAITRAQLEGKVVMVNFWATWCAPCKAEVPALTATYHKHKHEGFELFGVMTDDVDNPALERFSKSFNLKYPVVRADYALMEAFKYPPNLPTTFIYDRSGKLVFERKGALREAELDRVLSKLLN